MNTTFIIFSAVIIIAYIIGMRILIKIFFRLKKEEALNYPYVKIQFEIIEFYEPGAVIVFKVEQNNCREGKILSPIPLPKHFKINESYTPWFLFT